VKLAGSLTFDRLTVRIHQMEVEEIYHLWTQSIGDSDCQGACCVQNEAHRSKIALLFYLFLIVYSFDELL